ncbi:MATE family efflux transporter [Paracoccus denitrificans]|jgi:MATE family multidrug resistance protein|uniref:MATE efflux family protein n=1 Tax=Paracoccus denitrificans (strain Pd 1222) TaxID=318586 RepID=A1B603_PARDP|nr:MATE family efflux transporter [Paracoccus denitrificans]ABL70947.1 MATE efflux family protein [Paracoccus denitrificans PD1222]MBB4626602.1 MATE family multidrug resistance protein [Paracoccus denitrificans]MCU7428755.1 MATE family efflux transporter [Paracoccus denitrificans]QAR27625.1 MATE family efflux transporter [Paracoccus denitrificans]UPV97313.1 MATE family efflux transporter [Paracoccus denitrificans]
MVEALPGQSGRRAKAEISNRRVLAIALPVVLSNATIPILGAVDTGVIGQLGEAAPIGAVGLGAVILASIYWIFGFLRMGTSGLVAQAHGAGDEGESGAHLLRALGIGLAAGLVFILLQGSLFAAAFRLAPASAEVEALARQYLALRIWGAPAAISLYAITGWLIAIERTRRVLVLQLLMNGLNILLDLWFVLGLGWGVRGVAGATLIAEWSGLALGLWFARHALHAAIQRAGLLARERIQELARVNGDIMIRSVLLQGSFTTFMFMAAGQGDVTLAANQVLLQFLSIVAYGLDGFAFAAESLVGQAVGARRPDRLRRAAALSSAWGVAGAALLSAAFLLGGPAIIDLLTTAPEVRAEAREFLPWLVAAPLVGIASWMLDGIFIGATRTREMRNAMLVTVGIYAVLVVVLPPVFGNHGLWAALMGLNALRGLTMWRLYHRVEAAAA